MNILDAILLSLPLVYGSEGFEPVAFLDTLARIPVWTIGHGTTVVNGKPVCEGMTCTREQADAWATDDLSELASEVLDRIRTVVTDPQFAACLSLAYNIGIGAFSRSTVLEALNERLFFRAADRFLQYDHADGVEVPGLLTRRKRERALFLSGTAPAPHIPSYAVRPVLSVPPCPVTAPAESDADKLNDVEIAAIALHHEGLI
jgi:lysozyme